MSDGGGSFTSSHEFGLRAQVVGGSPDPLTQVVGGSPDPLTSRRNSRNSLRPTWLAVTRGTRYVLREWNGFYGSQRRNRQ